MLSFGAESQANPTQASKTQPYTRTSWPFRFTAIAPPPSMVRFRSLPSESAPLAREARDQPSELKHPRGLEILDASFFGEWTACFCPEVPCGRRLWANLLWHPRLPFQLPVFTAETPLLSLPYLDRLSRHAPDRPLPVQRWFDPHWPCRSPPAKPGPGWVALGAGSLIRLRQLSQGSPQRQSAFNPGGQDLPATSPTVWLPADETVGGPWPLCGPKRRLQKSLPEPLARLRP